MVQSQVLKPTKSGFPDMASPATQTPQPQRPELYLHDSPSIQTLQAPSPDFIFLGFKSHFPKTSHLTSSRTVSLPNALPPCLVLQSFQPFILPWPGSFLKIIKHNETAPQNNEVLTLVPSLRAYKKVGKFRVLQNMNEMLSSQGVWMEYIKYKTITCRCCQTSWQALNLWPCPKHQQHEDFQDLCQGDFDLQSNRSNFPSNVSCMALIHSKVHQNTKHAPLPSCVDGSRFQSKPHTSARSTQPCLSVPR